MSALICPMVCAVHALAADGPPTGSDAAPSTLTVDAVVEEVVRRNPELDF